jgi:hypothetical protein
MAELKVVMMDSKGWKMAVKKGALLVALLVVQTVALSAVLSVALKAVMMDSKGWQKVARKADERVALSAALLVDKTVVRTVEY